jgi:hypothetical protein
MLKLPPESISLPAVRLVEAQNGLSKPTILGYIVTLDNDRIGWGTIGLKSQYVPSSSPAKGKLDSQNHNLQ